jgi:arylsulfatase A-like enzyme
VLPLVLLALHWLLPGAAGTLQAEVVDRPNIVLILADDLGWRDLGCMGSQFYETPAIDGLAAKGLLFSRAYASAPVCLPTRAALMTGKSPARLGMTAVFDRDRGEKPLLPPDWPNELPHDEVTLAEYLREHGYATAIIGKWHLGITEENWPEHHGFDHNVGGTHIGRPPSYFSPYQNPRIADGPEGEYLTERLAAEAVNFIGGRGEQPFFLYFSLFTPHSPLEAREEVIGKYREKSPVDEQDNPVYAAMITHMDEAVNRVLQALEQEGIAEETLVIFTSDNGGVRTIWDQHFTSNKPLRGEKFQLYEGGIRVPLIVRWPGVTPEGKVTEQLAISTDFLPTILDILQVHPHEPLPDGVSLLPVLRQGDAGRFGRDLFWHFPHYMPRQDMAPASALRDDRFKLLHHYEDHRLELFDLSRDPGETLNLAPEQPGKALQMFERLREALQQTGALLPRPNPAHAEGRRRG